MYVFILQQDNTQNIKPEGQQGSEALTAARNNNKNVSNKYFLMPGGILISAFNR